MLAQPIALCRCVVDRDQRFALHRQVQLSRLSLHPNKLRAFRLEVGYRCLERPLLSQMFVVRVANFWPWVTSLLVVAFLGQYATFGQFR